MRKEKKTRARTQQTHSFIYIIQWETEKARLFMSKNKMKTTQKKNKHNTLQITVE